MQRYLTNMARKKQAPQAVEEAIVEPVVEQVATEEPKKGKDKRKFIYGSEILSERKVEDRVSIQTFDGLTYLLSKDEYAELVS